MQPADVVYVQRVVFTDDAAARRFAVAWNHRDGHRAYALASVLAGERAVWFSATVPQFTVDLLAWDLDLSYQAALPH